MSSERIDKPKARTVGQPNGAVSDVPISHELPSQDLETQVDPESPNLLRWGDRALLSEPWFSRLAPGTLLCNRYEILAFLGKGGMGAVYKARDLELTRSGQEELIAVKVLLPELSCRADLLQLFKRETKLARGITHKNVVNIFNLERDGDLYFLTMEFVRGENLQTLLEQRHHYPPEEAAALLTQVACGLDAIHGANVIHRDLKPRNVMVEKAGRVVVMDFGLARTHAGEATETAVLMGTPAYMCPEQFLKGSVDHRCDIYALGITFYELLTGSVPSAPNLSALQKGEPVCLPDISIPAPAVKILEKCLALQQEHRYQSVQEVLADLDEWIHPHPIATASAKALNSWRVMALACLLVVLTMTGYTLWNRFGTEGPHAPVSLLIADFQNNSGDAVLGGGTLESVLGIALERAPFVSLYNSGTAHKTAQKLSGENVLTESLAHQVAMREGIQRIVAGELSRSGSEYKLRVRVMDTGKDKPIFSHEVTADSMEQVLKDVSTVGAAIRKALGDTRTPAEMPETFTAASLQAIHAYAVAQEFMLEGKYTEADVNYQQAIHLDPNLGRAYAGLAASYRNQGNTKEALRYYGEALQHIARMTDREKYRTRGGYYITRVSPDNAIEEFTQLVKEYPEDNAGLANLALAYFYKRDMAKALEYGRLAADKYPKNVAQRDNVALYAMYAGNFEVAIQEAKKVLSMDPAFKKAYIAIALSQLAEQHPDEAAETYRKLESMNPQGASMAAVGLADLARYGGRLNEAIGILRKGIEADIQAKNTGAAARKTAVMAQYYLDAGRTKEALSSADQALLLDGSREDVLFLTGRVYAAARPEKTKELIAKLAEGLTDDSKIYAKLLDAETRLAHGDKKGAVDTLLEVKGSDTWIGHFDLARAYVESGESTAADSEAERCLHRAGEATAVFLDDIPSFSSFVPVYYYHARAEEGMKSPEAKTLFQDFLAINKKADYRSPLIEDARTRLGRLN